MWPKQVAKTRGDVFNPSSGQALVGLSFSFFKPCSTEKKNPENPQTDYPSAFMTVSDYLQKSSSKKRKANKLQQASRCLLPNVKEPGGKDDGNYDTDEEMEVDTDYSVSVPM